MTTSIGWIALTGYAMVQSIFFIFVFLLRKSRFPLVKWLLASISLCCAAILFEDLVSLTYGYHRFPHLIFSMNSLWYLLCPLLFIYLRIQISGRGLTSWDFMHLLPFVLIFYNLLSFYGLPAHSKLNYLDSYGNGEGAATIHKWSYIIFFIQAFVYVVLSLKLLRASTTSSNRTSYKILLAGLLAFAVFGLIAVLSTNLKSDFLVSLNCNLFLIWLIIFVGAVFVQSVRNPSSLFFVMSKTSDNKNGQTLGPDLNAILYYLESESPFLDADYDIHLLAKTLNCSKNHVRSTIRAETNGGFRDFINGLRINEAKKRLNTSEASRYTIQSIAENVGFKSSATFYRVFKRSEGLTPTEYINRQ